MNDKISTYVLIGILFILATFSLATAIINPSAVFVPYVNANQTVDLNGQNLINVSTFIINNSNSSLKISEIIIFGGTYKMPLLTGLPQTGNAFTAFADAFMVIDDGLTGANNKTFFYLSDTDGTESTVFEMNAALNTFNIYPQSGYTTTITQPLRLTGTVSLGANTHGNLTTGDLNASIIYVDQLTYKSPEWVCDQASAWCKITSLAHQVTLYIQFDNLQDLNIQGARFNGQDYTPQEFNQQICQASQRNQNACNKIINKINKRQCQNDGFSHWDGTTCRENPYLKCNAQSDTVWSFSTSTCDYSEIRECESAGNNWNQFSNTCVIVNNTPTQAELQNQCIQNIGMIWDQGVCKTLEDFYS